MKWRAGSDPEHATNERCSFTSEQTSGHGTFKFILQPVSPSPDDNTQCQDGVLEKVTIEIINEAPVVTLQFAIQEGSTTEDGVTTPTFGDLTDADPGNGVNSQITVYPRESVLLSPVVTDDSQETDDSPTNVTIAWYEGRAEGEQLSNEETYTIIAPLSDERPIYRIEATDTEGGTTTHLIRVVGATVTPPHYQRCGKDGNRR